jgi:hypothetical protein
VKEISRSATIEDLIEDYPVTAGFMLEEGLPCLACGEPVWGTFEEVARRTGKSDTEIDVLIGKLKSRVTSEEK